MKTFTRLALALVVLVGLTVAVKAAEEKSVMLKGDIGCAHCTLKVEGVKECTDALQVTTPDGTKTVYMLVKNDVLTKFGHTCQGTKSVMVTGTVADKDGKKWLTATKIEEVKA